MSAEEKQQELKLTPLEDQFVRLVVLGVRIAFTQMALEQKKAMEEQQRIQANKSVIDAGFSRG